MLGRRLKSFILWRRCPWGRWHWRWGYCRCINADTEVTRRNWEKQDVEAPKLTKRAPHTNSAPSGTL